MLTLALAALLAAGPTATGRPAVTGTLQQGARLTATTGTWAGSATLSYAYQWYRCDAGGAHCSSIHGSTRATYTLVAKDVGTTIGLTVRATDTTGTTAAYASLAGIVAPAKQIAARSQPPVEGDPVVGRPLQAQAPAWTSLPGTLTYAWWRCNANARICFPIAGATSDTYTSVAADAGHTLIAAVRAGGRTALSLSTGVVRTAPGPVSLGAPAVGGSPQQGRQLRATAGAWSGAGSVAYSYQWYRCDANGAHCASIHGSTKATYTLVGKDVGKTIGLTVKATDSTGTTAAYASLTGLVASTASPLAATAQPTLAGTSELKVTGGTWSGKPTAFAYAWLRCNANGRLCAAIAGATTDAYTPVAADQGHALVAAVTATAGTARQTVLTMAVVPTV